MARFSIDPEAERARLARSMERDAGEAFLQHGGRSRTLGDLLHASHRVAGVLQAEREALAGREAFPPVGVYVRSPFHLAACVLGAWKARFRPVLVDPSSRGELDFLAGEFPAIRFLAPADQPLPRRGLPLPDLSPRRTASAPAPVTPPGLGDPCVSFFTSGSEGRAKLVPKTGRQIYTHVASASRMLGLPAGCRTLCLVPLVHILGFSYGFLAPLLAGGQTLVVTDALPALLREALLSFRPQAVVATAVHYRFLNAVLAADDALPDAVFVSSGAPLAPRDRATFEEKTGRRITELYGSTETAGIAWRRGDVPWTPYPGAAVKIEGGHVWVRSPWARSDGSDVFVETHDVAEPDGAGFRLLGRSGNIVKVGGKRFSSLEVEHVIRAHAAVRDAAVFPYERDGEPALAAFVVFERESAGAVKELRSYLARRLAAFKVPRSVLAVPDLPRKKLGKLDYAALLRLAEAIRPERPAREDSD